MTEEKKPQEKKQKVTSTLQTKQSEEKIKKASWTLERCKKTARRYASTEEWQKGAPSSYKAASAKGWIQNCSSVIVPKNVTKTPRREQQREYKKTA